MPPNKGLPVMPHEDLPALAEEAKALLDQLANLQESKSARVADVVAKVEQIVQALEAVQDSAQAKYRPLKLVVNRK